VAKAKGPATRLRRRKKKVGRKKMAEETVMHPARASWDSASSKEKAYMKEKRRRDRVAERLMKKRREQRLT